MFVFHLPDFIVYWWVILKLAHLRIAFMEGNPKVDNPSPVTPPNQVDCTVEQNLCHQMGVSGYPTIRMYPRGSKGDADMIISAAFILYSNQQIAFKFVSRPYNWVLGSNRYQPYPGNRRDVTSLHNWLQVSK